MDLTVTLGAVAGVLLLAVLAVRISDRVGLPSLLLYLAIGLVLGQPVVGIPFVDARLTETLGIAALVLILVEGGMTTRWSTVRPALGLGLVLSTVSVAVSIAVTGGLLHLFLDLGWRTALLWGAVLSSTDAAAVFSVLRSVAVPRRLAGTLELESGINDAPVVIAVVVLAGSGPIGWTTPLLVVYELAAGTVIGVLLGLGGAWALRRAALPATGLYPLASIAVCLLAYAGGQAVHASGLLATYCCALVLGNCRMPHRSGVLSFAEGTGWLAQIGLFVLLGLYVDPHGLPAAVLPAVIAAGVLLLAARPLSVLVAALPFRVPLREQAFLSWAGLRGAVPIVLALIAVTEAGPGYEPLVDVVFVLVVILTVVQGTTLPWVGRILGVVSRTGTHTVEVDSAPLDEVGAELLQVRVPQGSRLHGVYLRELRLPVGATVSLIVRDRTPFTPGGEARLREGDQFLVVSTREVRDAAEQRIRDVDRGGKLVRWHSGRRRSS
ncbi:potassium/proton antiporter [Pseudonocardia nematodicida]|uniref:Potassium/proton antiporter n=1 Tax=Pseudonocardia nematodicida TaxID=1206997 RepID=A0ABV1KDP8_9PSEU